MRRLPALSAACLCVAGFLISPSRAQDAGTIAAPNSVSSLLSESSQRLADGDYEGAIRDASTAVQLDPKNPSAYEARGSIYMQERLWDRAERDYAMAAKLSPDAVYKYKLAQIAYNQNKFDDAASRFAELESDPYLGDLSYYQSFLSNLIGGHESKASEQLAKRDQMPVGPSLYFCRGAWDLYHDDRAGASKAFSAASHAYDEATCERYITGLMSRRRFQLASVSFTDRSGTAYKNASVFLESAGLRVSTRKGWITLTPDQLPDDLSAFPEDLREQIVRRRAVQGSAGPPTPAPLLTFTTQSGQAYEQVRWALQDTGLSVLTENGWISLPFSELPADLSTFPPDLQQGIAEKRRTHPVDPAPPAPISFTTKPGKSYSSVKAILSNDGVHVLTDLGWIAVPFRDLPDDLSPFPEEWRSSITTGRANAATDTTGTRVVTFTTRLGVHYDEVRASIGRTGLRLITPRGLIAVPYNQLPSDDSVFPEEWREILATKEKEALKAKPDQVAK